MVTDNNNADCTPLRRHQCFKKNELQILHQIYVQDSYPSIDTLQKLADQLNVSLDKIRVSQFLYHHTFILKHFIYFLFTAMVQESTL